MSLADTSWVTEAACAGAPGDTFFPSTETGPAADRRYAQARAICQRCPVADECLEMALTENIRHGMWGGKSPAERREIAFAREQLVRSSR